MRLTQIYDDVAERGFQSTPDGMAHWAGTGPRGKTCRECVYFMHKPAKGYYSKTGGEHGACKPAPCRKFKTLMTKLGPPVPADSKACKHFQQNDVVPRAFAK